jgi:myo-inositol-1-phosphate synthase
MGAMADETNEERGRTGVFITGAYGDIAVTMIVGALALRHRLATPVGMVSELPAFADLDLVPLDGLRFGGIDVRDARLRESAQAVADASRTFPRAWVDAIAAELDEIDAGIDSRAEFDWNVAAPACAPVSLLDLADELGGLLRRFRRRYELERVIVLDLASVEVTPAPVIAHSELRAFEAALRADDRRAISPSMLRAHAALTAGCGYVNFTPNAGAAIPALDRLARDRGLPHAGNDAKTGETLIKSVLAPMFACRNLRVMSWEGVNMLGNRDGKALSDPARRATKISNKEELVPRLLGYPVHSGVDINYVPSLGDWKTAWDLVHFKGFLDVPMTMQFTWQGCDSILAAPLALDLVRFTEFALRQGEAGPLAHLASFFKSPVGVAELAFVPQFEALLRYAGVRARGGDGARNTADTA